MALYAKFSDLGLFLKSFGFEKSAWHPGTFLASTKHGRTTVRQYLVFE